ncbi:16S rRNA (cytosine(967)-C(5))-methyltransferase RsmB [Paenibacillus polymyxa]|uniref:16S rRNA (cytosine(967)-C(5))-methyltransferase RsmB n=1 Tax=Paenibacillus polymyxa TaxID=1406 RepID=UPI0002DB880E|nr:16S rRNA (cytosine(967)-C(5))-methyltransferase RsmB [Paenibacillus polymyxa]MEE4577085.1 16S rRNA (cytosine(967)-C(5))-methyltransferase RsmB [Paenibacillus polymyxa]NMP10896.1 16S rRNA (cytosine(967)-C(5))-methyltransferase RsmB [Paenibacillus polymyxa]QDA28701.1 16S rRNA (cytosine(967)-C(5))-methyltransferase RsmB [Paenibacillus polymyxa]RTZ35916.1 16S rRNA (cytosine(967)-C(5))-methyltransferase RsmB [Paenibacillus polymyxa]URJ34694.1 16S rRNA (cytosine(967)-C(5))-methyltransferase RsmB 
MSGGHSRQGDQRKGVGTRSDKTRKQTAREVALDVLTGVEQEGAYSNLELNRRLQQAGLFASDVGLTTELVYGTVARRNTLDYFLNKFVQKGTAKLQPWVRSLLRMSVYQLVYLDRVPDHAVVSEAVTIAKRRGHQGISGMVNGVLRSMLRESDKLRIPDGLSAEERISLEHSHPQWLVKRWIKQYGTDTAEAICKANNEPPAVSVRVNTTMTSRDQLLDEMIAKGIDAVPSAVSPYGIVVRSGGNMALTSWYTDGLLSVQDESSMLVAEAVAPEPGMAVLDCCAAPGGKTAHMAELMKDRGRIVANDLHAHKHQLIREQANRLGLDAVETVTGDALDLKERYAPASFDRILLDAPCSGFGVIRRKPDLRWSKTAQDVRDITQLQHELLDSVAGLLKPGGILVYSTCTIEPDENEGQLARFLSEHPEYELAKDHSFPAVSHEMDGIQKGSVQLLPQHFHSDGFYIARLRRVK